MVEAIIPRFRVNFSRPLCIEFQDILNQCKSVKSWFGVLQSLDSSAFRRRTSGPNTSGKDFRFFVEVPGCVFPVLVLDLGFRVGGGGGRG